MKKTLLLTLAALLALTVTPTTLMAEEGNPTVPPALAFIAPIGK